MHNNAGYTLIELLVVMGIIGILATIAIPSYSSYTGRQSVVQTAEDVKSEVRFALNKSYAGLNSSWFGIAFTSKQGDSIPSPNGVKSDSLVDFEITKPNDCTLTFENIYTSPCTDPGVKVTTPKKYKPNVYLDKIIRYDDQGNQVDTVPFAEIRFNRSPDVNQVALSFPTSNKPNIARMELVFKNRDAEQSVVIDGGNICNPGEISQPGKCSAQLTGGPRPGRVFVVEKN